LIAGLILALPLVLAACGKSGPGSPSGGAKKLTIFHAGSLSVPFKQIAEAFEKANPGIEVQLEAAGSRTCARKIADLGRRADVMGSADYTVINNLLIPEHADWNIRFAANEMTIVYTEHSDYGEELSAENWHEILMRPDVTFGRADPNSDPCGYRSVLTMRLAENYYGEEGLAERMLQKDTKYIRPKETDLLALLETGTLDYIFLYRSVAQQHGLRYLLLPDEINLKKEEFADTYAKASVEISGKEPGTTITKRGAPMVYGITVPKNAPDPDMGRKFVEFVLSEKGMAIMERNGQPSVVAALSETYEKIPETLKTYATK
jgi:molybdate/tungstate transport system substrate-binding protein